MRQLDARQVTSFVVGYCQGRNPESAKALVTICHVMLSAQAPPCERLRARSLTSRGFRQRLRAPRYAGRLIAEN